MRVLIVLAVIALAAVSGVRAMTEEEAEAVMSGRIREWPVPKPSASEFDNDTFAGEEEEQVRIGSGLGGTAACQCSVSATISNEGSRACCYYDTVGVPTIGVGHNINANPTALTKYGLNPTTVKNTCGQYTSYKAGYCLTQTQINDLFSIDFAPSQACAKQVAPNAPPCVMAALADMAFNLGCPGLKGFPSMLAAVNRKDWAQASYQAGNSKWCGQVKSRCPRDQSCLASGQ